MDLQIVGSPGKGSSRSELRTECDLYIPVKRYLESLGYSVKGEIGGCDLVGLRDDDRVLVVGELKLRFNLELLLQAVDRTAVADEVWLAVRKTGTRGRESDARVRKLCRLLGFGVLSISSKGQVDMLLAPGPYKPRPDKKRREKLVREHQQRKGDPMRGGGSRAPIMTAYRQQALLCASALVNAPMRPRDLKPQASDAPKILLRNVYGWFERVERGLYSLTEAGRAAVRAGQPGGPVETL
jgi:hypothetical protein